MSPASPLPYRIISDIHLGHPGSLVDDAGQIARLAEGVGTMILNGDSVEMRSREEKDLAAARLEALREVCRSNGTKVVFINGNHDPFASELNYLDLPGGVFVTHGDILFRGTLPWSSAGAVSLFRDASAIRKHGLMVSDHHEDACCKTPSALRGTEMSNPVSKRARNFRCIRELWPPRKALRILRFWLHAPNRAAALLREFRPEAKFMVLGHTHLASVTHHGGATVINTGSLKTWMGGRIVDVDENRLCIRQLRRSGRLFWAGEYLRTFSLSGDAACPSQSGACEVSS